MKIDLRRTRQRDPRDVTTALNGEPVLSKKDGYYGRAGSVQDEHGNQTVEHLSRFGRQTDARR